MRAASSALLGPLSVAAVEDDDVPFDCGLPAASAPLAVKATTATAVIKADFPCMLPSLICPRTRSRNGLERSRCHHSHAPGPAVLSARGMDSSRGQHSGDRFAKLI